MIRQKSVGFIIFRRHPKEGLQYLVLYHRGSYWNFPKGKMEEGESELETGLRELYEEAGLKDIKVIDGFREQTEFMFRETHHGGNDLIKKDFVIYLAEVPPGTEPKISHEHNGYGWFDLATAQKLVRFKQPKEILAEADNLIKTLKN